MIIVTCILLYKNLLKITSENFAARLKQGNLATKSGIDDFVEKTNFDDKHHHHHDNHLSPERRIPFATVGIIQK